MVNFLKRFFLLGFVYIGFYSSHIQAFVLDRPETWKETEKEYLEPLLAQGEVNFCRSVLVIRGWRDGLPLVENLSQDDVAGSNYFDFISYENLDWELKLNAADFTRLNTEGNNNKGAKYAELFSLSRAYCLIVASHKGWSLIQNKGIKLLVRNGEGLKRITEQSIKKWLKKNLGYDGIVLAREQNQVLIAGFSDDLREKNQKAIVIQNTAKIVKLKGSQGEGGALLSLKAFHRNFAVFQILRIASGAKIRVGDKIVLE